VRASISDNGASAVHRVWLACFFSGVLAAYWCLGFAVVLVLVVFCTWTAMVFSGLLFDLLPVASGELQLCFFNQTAMVSSDLLLGPVA